MGAVWQLVIPLLVLVVLVVLTTRGTRKQQQQMRDVQRSLSVGDRVMTNAGIYGTIRELSEESVELEVAAGVVITVHRQAIGRRVDETPKAVSDVSSDAQPPADPQSGMESE